MSAQPALTAPRDIVLPPNGPWRWAQTWRDLFFAHWQVSAASLQPHLPAGLKVDTWDGSGWVSAVAFRLDVRRRWLPPLGLWTSFVELNLRTYVRRGGEAGIYFLSIHAAKRMSVALARWLTPLPYVFAPIRYARRGEAWHFECGRPGETLFDVDFTPIGPAAAAAAADHALEAWLLERYRGFVRGQDGKMCRMVAQHPAWQIRRVEARVGSNFLGMPWGLGLNRQPDAAHFSAHVSARVWPFEPLAARPTC